MDNMPPAREGGVFVPVDHSASGAAAAFDGNLTNDLDSWMFQNSNWNRAETVPLFDRLMVWTAEGHLSWCVFVLDGYRI